MPLRWTERLGKTNALELLHARNHGRPCVSLGYTISSWPQVDDSIILRGLASERSVEPGPAICLDLSVKVTTDLEVAARPELERGKLRGASAHSVADVVATDHEVVVTWQPRGSDKLVEELVDLVVNVTGPDGNPRHSNCPLVQSLVEQRLCEPDGLGLGWGTDPAGRLFDANGEASRVLYYAGPSLRARHWEAIAVPELRAHVQRAVREIAGSLASSTGSYIRRIATPLFRRESALF